MSQQDNKLEISRVVLFKHGVGFFERTGVVTGDQAIELEFKGDQMNDLLKSLVALDLDGGKVASISYDSQEPLHRQLDQFSVQLNKSLPDFLNQLKGAEVNVRIKNSTSPVLGKVLDLRKNGDGETHTLSLINGSGIRQYRLEEVSQIQLVDPNLRGDIEHILNILIGDKKKDVKRVTIYTKAPHNEDGSPVETDRAFLVSYVVETSLWKTSYRILRNGETGKTTLIGYAIVDNTTQEDWEDVKLSLVAGSPLSFVHDLYSARHKQRPTVGDGNGVNIADMVEGVPIMEVAGATPKSAGAHMRMSKGFSGGRESVDYSQVAQESMQVETSTQEVGDLFHYDIDVPVSVGRNQSAKVPLLQKEFNGDRVIYYHPRLHDANPMTAMYFRNTTGLTLEGGPITVMEDGHYVGEAFMDLIRPKDKRILPYSIELGVKVKQDDLTTKETAFHMVKAKHGTLTFYRYRVQTTTYKITNKTDREFRFFLDHPHRQGWDLVDTQEPYDRSTNHLRFDLKLAPNENMTFKVSERGDQTERRSLSSLTPDILSVWIENGFFQGDLKDKLNQISSKVAEVAQLSAERKELVQLEEKLFKEENHCAELFAKFGSGGSDVAQAYVNDATEAKNKRRTTRELIESLEHNIKNAKNEVNALADELDFETPIKA